MQSTNSPTKMPIPFASSGTMNVIPIPSQIGVNPGLASFTTGFPPLTFTPIAAGGIPPFGADFNGVFNAITQALRWSNAGGQYTYDPAFAAAVGGYPNGALLQKSTLNGFWLNTTDNNSTNPDAGGAGWVNPFAGRLLGVTPITSSQIFTPNPLANSTIVECLGGGGAGGGAQATSASQGAASVGGSCGSYIKAQFVGPLSGPITATIGAGGVPGAAGAVRGGAGGTTSFGVLVTAPGGDGGSGGVAVIPPNISSNIAGAVHLPSTTGTAIVAMGTALGTPGFVIGTVPGQNQPGGGCGCIYGFPASGYGAGGIGTGNSASLPAASGSAGNSGLILVWEYA